ERSRPGAYPLFLYPARPTAALHALSLHDALPIFEFIEKLLKLWTNIMNGQFAGFIAGNASDHVFQRMIGSQLIASPGNGCNLEQIGRARASTPGTFRSRMPSTAREDKTARPRTLE